MTTIDDVLAVLAARHDRLEEMLAKLGWPLPGHLGSKWLDDVAQLFLSGQATSDEVEAGFLRNYRAHGLEDIRRTWTADGLIAARLPILLDALKAHEEERYNLSVPVVLAQLEGMVAKARQHEGRFNMKTLFEYLEPIAARGSRFQRIAAQLVVDTLWVEFRHGATLPPLSRHAILHGADTKYGTGANSLRAILYFDTIRAALSKQAA
jgi:hypothetical protein